MVPRLVGVTGVSLIFLPFLPRNLLRLIQKLDWWVIALAHDFTVDQFPEDYLSVSTCRQDPLHMITLGAEHLGRELEFE